MSWVIDFTDVGPQKRGWQLVLDAAPQDAIDALRQSVETQGALKGPSKRWRFVIDPDGGCGYVMAGNAQAGQFTYHRAVEHATLAATHEEPAAEATPEVDPAAPLRLTRAELAEQTPPVFVVPDAAEREREVLRDRVVLTALDLLRAHQRLAGASDARRRRVLRFEVANCESYLLEAVEAATPAALASAFAQSVGGAA